jgi:hypothetical protein
MKAERRHELKTNALARGLEGLPDYWREYGNKVLLVIIAALVVFLIVRYWREKRAHDAQVVAESLQTAQTALQELDRLPMGYLSALGQGAALATQRQTIVQNAETSINSAINDAKDPQALARAYLAKGELNWKLANMPEIPGAQTQPSLRMSKSPEDFLSAARSAYEQVLQPQFAGDPFAVFQARLGLAAIAENQQQWETARKQYEAIANAANFPPEFKSYAKDRLAELPQLEKPALLGEGPNLFGNQPTTTTAPAPLGPFPLPETGPTTVPSSAPATSAPTTQPTR